MTITPVLLCGGSGTRLWPLSRASRPKPFLPLIGDKTLFEATLERCHGSGFADPIVVTGAAHVALVDDQAKDLRLAEVIVEPEPKQTAAAVAVAALSLPRDVVMLVCPSDHHIENPAAFANASLAAAKLAGDGWLVCLTIAASEPDTRFGYVRRGDAIGTDGFRVAEFVEKPQQPAAEAYVASGQFAWNSGIFAFRAGDYLDELERHRPALMTAVRDAVAGGHRSAHYFHPGPAPFSAIEAESLDYAVMENTDRAAMVMAEMGWSDVGSWPAVHEMRTQDDAGNSVRGPARLIDCRNVLVQTDGPEVHLLGLEDVVVVIDGTDVLVASTAAASNVGGFAKPIK